MKVNLVFMFPVLHPHWVHAFVISLTLFMPFAWFDSHVTAAVIRSYFVHGETTATNNYST